MNLLAATIHHFRVRRMRLFCETLAITERTRILDVGGTALNWMLAGVRPRVTLVNMPRGMEPAPPGFQSVAATGCELPFPDRAFDVVCSNSVIEHIGNAGERRRFANEIRRVGKSYWVETPNRWFPVEPHLCTPLIHFLPRRWQGAIVRRATVWDILERPSADRREFYIEHYLSEVRLLSASDLAELFPDAHIIRERFLGVTKSLIAAGR